SLSSTSTMVFSLFHTPYYSMQDEPRVLFLGDLLHKRRCPSSRVPQITQSQKKEESRREGNEPIKINLHVGNSNPEEIKVSLSGRLLTVEGTHSSSSDSSSFSSSFKRTITLNDHIDLSTVYSKIAQ
ncbi:hypothetical protein PMAYCL1PPCAC_12793, partial [Pristionchus mayeri]